MNAPQIVSPKEWEAAREQLLVKEKELTRTRDAMAAARRRMPWMAVEKEYAFEGPEGPASLLDLFAGRRQLIVYRFFFEPGVRSALRTAACATRSRCACTRTAGSAASATLSACCEAPASRASEPGASPCVSGERPQVRRRPAECRRGHATSRHRGMELSGLEPLTSWVRSRRSPN